MFAAMAGEVGCRREELEAMAAALPGRPDAALRDFPAVHGPRVPGSWLDDSGAFAATFRAVSPLADEHQEQQPYVDQELIFVCRARLDDRSGLLQQLQIEPARGLLLSDSEILRLCYKRWREQTPHHVYGDFAFVAWERWSRRTVAATDHLGNFTLFYCRAGGRMLFATQLSALLACPAVHPKLDLQALATATQGTLGPEATVFDGIKLLAGGELLIHHDEMMHLEHWWCPDTVAREVHSTGRDYVEEARVLFESAVDARLRGRSNVVATLTGSLDSALVAVTAARQLSSSGKVLEAYTPLQSVTDARHAQSDAAYAAAVAEFQPNIRQRLIPSGTVSPLDILPKVHAFSHTVVSDVAELVWQWQLSARASRGRVRAVLCSGRGDRSINYAGDLCDANFIRLRRVASAAQQAWDRVRCIGMTPRTGRMSYEQHVQVEGLERQMFAQAMIAPRRSARVDFMAHHGVDWLDPTGDRKLLERLLTFPLHIFRVGNRPQGLAREIGRSRLPDSVRLRRRPALAAPDCSHYFRKRAAHYQRALQTLRHCSACDSFIDYEWLQPAIESLCAGSGSATDAAGVHRMLDAGLLAAYFESGHRATPIAKMPDIAPAELLSQPASQVRVVGSSLRG